MNRSNQSGALSMAFAVACACLTAQTGAQTAKDLLDASGVHGGLIVHIGVGDGTLTAALRANDACVVRGLDTAPARVEEARKTIRSMGTYGKVSVAEFDGKTLPMIDNLLNLIVVSDAPSGVSPEEIARALAPLGVALIKEAGNGNLLSGLRPPVSPAGQGYMKYVKPWPPNIDEWQQYLHDADNNAVANDTVVGPPRHMQWVTEPAWSRSHMTIPTVVSLVSSKGRLFSIEDQATEENPFLPGRFALVARDAFNGILLWKHEFSEWEPVTRYIKDIAVQLQRRLVAIGDTVYCTPGLSAPVTAFDAATGKVLKVYKGTERTQEFAYYQGVLYLVIGDRMNSARYNIVKLEASKGISLGGSDPQAPFDGTGFRGKYAPETPDKENPTCAIVAIDADSGKELWREDNIRNYVGCALAIRGRYAVFQTQNGLFCRDPKTGAEKWSVRKSIASNDGTEANTLVLSDDTVYAQEGKSLFAYSLENGSEKWSGPVAYCYEKPADVFLVGEDLWTGGTKPPACRDARTGRQKLVINQKMTGPMGHDRCYRNFITTRFYINSKTGGADFCSLDGKKEFPNHWVRGTCGMGVLPCNGLLYAPPFSCQCSIGAMINNFNAVYTEKNLASPNQDIEVKRAPRLIKGPSYGYIGEDSRPPWPTYRHDGRRNGFTTSRTPGANLKQLWKASLKGVPSALVIAEDKVFVCDVNAHTLYALNASDGAVAWDYVAGGRVDSPPTYYKGLLLFGSRDGWAHCLRASDGALAWRLKDLPDRMIGAFGQLESAWPLNGSALVKDGIAYFVAGRSSFLDGGISLYGLDPKTGAVIHQRRMYGPFQEDTGFPTTGANGFKSDVLVTDGKLLYVRHQAFNPDLTPADSPGRHLIPSAGFLDGTPQHRTYWTIGSGYSVSLGGNPSGDILVTDGRDFYEVRGFAVKRHSYFDPRLNGYTLFAGTIEDTGAGKSAKRKKKAPATPDIAAGKWRANIPLTGRAMALAGDIVFVAGNPAMFPEDDLAAGYEGRLGGVLWAASTKDGKRLAQYALDAAPAWDGMAAAEGRLYMSLEDGSVVCWEGK